jgi:flavodoxin
MKALVIYDTMHGNTEKVARAIGERIPGAKVIHANNVTSADLENIDILFVGSPTHGGRPMQSVQKFIKEFSTAQKVLIATFDTRFDSGFARIFGYASKRIANPLRKKGANIIAEPEGFIVEKTEGPLREGELERAANWAEGILKRFSDYN